MSLPVRTIPELIASLRERASRLSGTSWEVPATQAMMQEAADRLTESEARYRTLVATLRAHEWADVGILDGPFCRVCDRFQADGHEPTCWLKALLADAAPEPPTP